MFRCLEPGALGISLPWDQCVALAAQHGFEGIDVPVDPARPVAWYRDRLARHRLQPGGRGLPVCFRDDRQTFETDLAALPAVARHAAAIGVTRFPTWILPASDTLPWRDNFRFHVERLAPCAQRLADHGCRLGLEFVGPKTARAGHRYGFIHTLHEMLELCAAVGPNCGLLLDSWHWYTSLGTVEELLELTNDQIVYVHINDAPRGLEVDRQMDLVRRIPGETGVIDLPAFLDALRQVGYDGPVVPEPFVPELGRMPPEAAAQRVGEALQRVWSAAPRPALPTTMKAVALGRRKAWLVDVPVPRPVGSQVLVKLHASPICGSNMGAYCGEGEHVNIGHEGAGEIVAVAQSQRLKVGDRVALAPPISCGVCDFCQRGETIFCANRPPMSGCFAGYACVSDAVCTLIPDDIDTDRAALLGCALGPATEALRQLAVTPFDTVVVSGLGPVGLGATALAAFHGARVIGLDPEPFRRDLARRAGAELTLDPAQPDTRERLRTVAGPEGVRKAVECSGKEAAERLLLDVAGVRATLCIVGENHGTIPVSPSEDFIRKGLRVVGCWHMNVFEAPKLFEFLRRAAERADTLITHRFGFGRVQEAFDAFASGRCSKVILHPWE